MRDGAFRAVKPAAFRPNKRVKLWEAEEWYSIRLNLYEGNLRQAARMKQYRTERGVSQQDVANLMDCTAGRISRLETARCYWNQDLVSRFKVAVKQAVELYK